MFLCVARFLFLRSLLTYLFCPAMNDLQDRCRCLVQQVSTEKSKRDALRMATSNQVVQHLGHIEQENNEPILRYIYSVLFSNYFLSFFDVRSSLPVRFRDLIDDVYKGLHMLQTRLISDPNQFLRSAKRVDRLAICWWWLFQGPYLSQWVTQWNQIHASDLYLFVHREVSSSSRGAVDYTKLSSGSTSSRELPAALSWVDSECLAVEYPKSWITPTALISTDSVCCGGN